MTDTEKIEILQGAAVRADRTLEWILGEPGYPEKVLTMARRVRNTLQSALKRTGAPVAADGKTFALPAAKLGKRAIETMKANGILKEAKRK